MSVVALTGCATLEAELMFPVTHEVNSLRQLSFPPIHRLLPSSDCIPFHTFLFPSSLCLTAGHLALHRPPRESVPDPKGSRKSGQTLAANVIPSLTRILIVKSVLGTIFGSRLCRRSEGKIGQWMRRERG